MGNEKSSADLRNEASDLIAQALRAETTLESDMLTDAAKAKMEEARQAEREGR